MSQIGGMILKRVPKWDRGPDYVGVFDLITRLPRASALRV
jgi:hypothetical protein